MKETQAENPVMLFPNGAKAYLLRTDDNEGRDCVCCGLPRIAEGFIDGDDYYCSEACLLTDYTQEEADAQFSAESEYQFWTQWEDDPPDQGELCEHCEVMEPFGVEVFCSSRCENDAITEFRVQHAVQFIQRWRTAVTGDGRGVAKLGIDPLEYVEKALTGEGCE